MTAERSGPWGHVETPGRLVGEHSELRGTLLTMPLTHTLKPAVNSGL